MPYPRDYRRLAVLASCAYAALCGAYIWLSDRLVLALVGGDVERFSRISIYKGWGFVGATALGLFLLLLWAGRVAAKSARHEKELLAESNQRLRMLVEGTPHLFFYLQDLDGQVTYISPTVTGITGRTMGEWLGQHHWFVTDNPINDRAREATKRHLAGQFDDEPIIVESTHADGHPVMLEVYEYPRFRNGKLVGIQGIAHDVTRTRQAEERIHFQASLLDHARNGIAATDPDGIVTFWNRHAEAMFGWSEEEVLGRQLAEILVPVGGRTIARGVIATLRRTGAWEGELDARRRDGTPVVLHVAGSLIRDSRGTPRGFVAVATDVTERKRGEQVRQALYAISEAASRADTVEELLPAIHQIVGRMMPAENFYIALVDPVGGMLSFPYFVDQYDEPPAPTPLGRGLTEYVLRTGAATLVSPETFDRLVSEGEVDSVGTPSIDWLGVPLRLGDRVIGVLVVQTYTPGIRYHEDDLRLLEFVSAQVAAAIERVRAEHALRESEERYRSLVELSPEGILIHCDGVIVFANDAFARTLGYPAGADLVGRTAIELVAPEFREIVLERIRHAVVRGEPQPLLHERFLRADGTVVDVEAASTPFSFRGQPASQVVVRDITERLRLEDQLRQAQKLEAVGRLAGGVAHDFNNLLQAVLASVGTLKSGANDEATQTMLHELEEHVHRGAAMTRQLLLFARRDVIRFEPNDLNDIIRGAASLLRRLVRENIRLAVTVGAGELPVLADRRQIEQVLVNLVVNAVDAMPEGGELCLRTGRDGDEVWFSVHDGGTGISDDVRGRIFEPFFTTKGVGHGSGLGLAVVHGIVASHRGRIDLDSAIGRGTQFTIHLPLHRVEQSSDAETPIEIGAIPTGQGEPVLIVEDEPLVREGLAHSVRALGYQVTAVGSAEDALIAARRDNVDVLITDLMLPGMNGMELARRLRELVPDLPTILMSGYAEERVSESALEQVRFLQKPFDLATLARELRLALDERGQGGPPP